MAETAMEGSSGSSVSRQTAYVVLRELEGEGDWHLAARVDATNALEAIKRHVSSGVDEGTFVALPARSWHPRTVFIERKERVRVT